MESQEKKVGQKVHTVSYAFVVPDEEPETIVMIVKNTSLDTNKEVNAKWLNDQIQILSGKMFNRAIKQKARAAKTEHLELHLKAKKV